MPLELSSLAMKTFEEPFISDCLLMCVDIFADMQPGRVRQLMSDGSIGLRFRVCIDVAETAVILDELGIDGCILSVEVQYPVNGPSQPSRYPRWSPEAVLLRPGQSLLWRRSICQIRSTNADILSRRGQEPMPSYRIGSI